MTTRHAARNAVVRASVATNPSSRRTKPTSAGKVDRPPAMGWIGAAAATMVFSGYQPASAQNVIGPGTYSQIIAGSGDTIVQGPVTVNGPATANAWGVYVLGSGSVGLNSAGGPISINTAGELAHAMLVRQISTVTSTGTQLSFSTTGAGAAGLAVREASEVSLSDATIVTSGGLTSSNVGAYGVSVTSGADVDLTRGSITTSGLSGAVFVRGANLDMFDVAITVGDGASDRSHGVIAQTAGSVYLARSTITLGRTRATGLFASGIAGPAASIQAVSPTVLILGDDSHGAVATVEGARVALWDANIETRGDRSAGLYAIQTGQIVARDGTTVLTSGVDSYGTYARAGAAMELADSAITTTGVRGHGIRAGDSNTTLTATDVTVDTAGADAVGASAFGGGSLAMTRGSIATSGTAAHGLTSSGIQSTATLSGTTIETLGAAAHATAAWSGGAIRGTSVTARASGDEASALFLNGVTPIGGNGEPGPSSAAFDTGSNLSSTTAPAIAIAGGTGNVQLTDSEVTGDVLWLRVGAGNAFSDLARRRMRDPAREGLPEPQGNTEAADESRLLTVADVAVSNFYTVPGRGNVTATASQITGAALTDAGSISDVRLLGGTNWDMTGNSNLTLLTVDNSQIVFSPPVGGAFKTLTVDQYVGNNGAVRLNTVLAGDGSPSDRLVVNNTASGSTRLQIVNAGGAGALTQSNGIRVVEAAGVATTTADAFALDGRVVAGPYEYRLFRGSTDASSPQSWYLRSQQQPDPQPPEPQPPQPQPPEPQPPEPPQPPQPQPPSPPEPPRPLFRPEVAAYLANQRVAGQMFVHSLHDRLGEPQFIESQRAAALGAGAAPMGSGWLRAVGNWESSRSADSQFDVDTDTFLLQGGAELARWSAFGGADRVHLGVMGSYVNSRSDASAQGNSAGARGKVDGFLAGVYATWYQNDENRLGAYADGWFQYGWFDNEVEGQGLPAVKYDGHGYAVSGELGYAVPLRAQWVVEPQAQLIYVSNRTDDATEPNGTRISGADADGVLTRLGVRLHRTVQQSATRLIQPYLTLNWWHGDAGESVRFDQISVGDLYPENRYEVKLGVNAQFDRRWSGWANVAGAWGKQDYDQYTVRVGVKYTW